MLFLPEVGIEINHMMPTYIDFKIQIKSDLNTFLIPVADDAAKLNIENHLSKVNLPFLIKDATKDFFVTIEKISYHFRYCVA